ncbi:MAG: CarD family transcriptional regulator, partial [Alphaproteobacteria bacterium]|nr:CarD family transcriptional regulator [Alphaproteobacteria bacterium]
MTKIKEINYQDGDFVVYPTHGVGKILGTETSQIAGTEVQLMVIRF